MTEIHHPKIKEFNIRSIERANSQRKRHQPSHQAVVGDYQILEKIGMGGFATVRKAIHIPTGIKVAVKIISLLKLTDFQRKSIKREINIHKRLIHQNIAQIYQVIEESDRLLVFMEFCCKGELFEYINSHGPMPKNRARRVFKEIYSAVCYLHENKIVHRDIKTQNILLDQNDHAKLIDFGLANYYGDDENEVFLKTFCGSPSYLSPEMVKKTKYDARGIDVWCLGVTLYAILTAQLPFYDSDPDLQKQKIKRIEFCEYGDESVDELFNGIFAPSPARISLQQIRQTEFFQQGKQIKPQFLSFDSQELAIDEQISEQINKLYGVDSNRMRDSLREKKLDNLYSLYYLTLEKNRKIGFESCYDVKSSIFMKDCDLKKLRKSQKHSLTPFAKRKQIIEPSTAASTPKSLKKVRNGDLIRKTKKSIIFDQSNEIMSSNPFTKRRLKGLQVKIPRRNSEESPQSPQRIHNRRFKNSKDLIMNMKYVN